MEICQGLAAGFVQHIRQVEFTPAEKRALAVAITKAIIQCWDALLNINARSGRDWEPVDTCVSDIAEPNASGIDNPAAVEFIDPEAVAEYFSDPETSEEEMIRRGPIPRSRGYPDHSLPCKCAPYPCV